MVMLASRLSLGFTMFCFLVVFVNVFFFFSLFL